MKIAMIGSTQYQAKFAAARAEAEEQGHTVLEPAFDGQPLDELQIVDYNRALVESADEVWLIWDGRSIGTVFDLGMVFALRKPLRIWYLESKSMQNVARMMAGMERTP